MARVPLVDREAFPEEYQYLLGEDALGERNVFRAIGNAPPVLQSYMRYGTTLWEAGELTTRERELLILAVARALDSEYEWHQHVDIGREAGLTDEEIAAIGRGADENFENCDGFDDRDRALLAYADAFARGEVTDTIHDGLAEFCETSTLTGVAMLCSHYVATARALDALAVPLEGPFVGWQPEE
ncbi:carboxymuconolactone decarboxylase family protein [Halobacteriales archaeon QS_3_64_16]|nr:MAG: carboxymuconolactone decarboxylase family protein [Halobacteriales archaeon QS_3_64_16]